MCGLVGVLTKEGLQKLFLKSSWEEGHGENSKFFIGFMKEESVRGKNGCGNLLRACSSAKVSIKEGWKGLAEVVMRRGVDGESGGADVQCGARRCSPTNEEPSFVRARWHTGAPRGWWSWWWGWALAGPTPQSASSSCFFCSPPPL